MKRFFFVFLLFFLFVISFPRASYAESDRKVTILFTGAVKGTIDPCAA